MSTKKTVLVVDDESDVLLIVKTALLSEGYHVLTATNGPDALTIAMDNALDLMILDIMMPEMNGFEVLQRLRETPKTESLPVIMLTGVVDKTNMRHALDQGIVYYITKPFEFQDLLSKVKIVIAGGVPGGFEL